MCFSRRRASRREPEARLRQLRAPVCKNNIPSPESPFMEKKVRTLLFRGNVAFLHDSCAINAVCRPSLSRICSTMHSGSSTLSTGNRDTHRPGRDASFGSSAYVSFRFTHLLDQVVEALVMLRPGNRAMRQKFGKERFLPQEQLMILFFVGERLPSPAFDLDIHGACHSFRIAEVKSFDLR